MHFILIVAAGLLVGCTAVISEQVETINTVKELALTAPPTPPVQVEPEGSEFFAKFSTTSALNAKRAFVSDYHGEVRVILFPNRQVECRWWTEGRVTDETVYEGPNGFLKAFSTLCKGKLQRDGSFEFQGAYIAEGPGDTEQEEQEDATFTIRGKAFADTISGEIRIGNYFRNDIVIADPDVRVDDGEGVKFEAVYNEEQVVDQN